LAIIDSEGVGERSLFLAADTFAIATNWILALRDLFVQHRTAVRAKGNTSPNV
jgi:hypothetical protein